MKTSKKTATVVTLTATEMEEAIIERACMALEGAQDAPADVQFLFQGNVSTELFRPFLATQVSFVGHYDKREHVARLPLHAYLKDSSGITERATKAAMHLANEVRLLAQMVIMASEAGVHPELVADAMVALAYTRPRLDDGEDSQVRTAVRSLIRYTATRMMQPPRYVFTLAVGSIIEQSDEEDTSALEASFASFELEPKTTKEQ